MSSDSKRCEALTELLRFLYREPDALWGFLTHFCGEKVTDHLPSRSGSLVNMCRGATAVFDEHPRWAGGLFAGLLEDHSHYREHIEAVRELWYSRTPRETAKACTRKQGCPCKECKRLLTVGWTEDTLATYHEMVDLATSTQDRLKEAQATIELWKTSTHAQAPAKTVQMYLEICTTGRSVRSEAVGWTCEDPRKAIGVPEGPVGMIHSAGPGQAYPDVLRALAAGWRLLGPPVKSGEPYIDHDRPTGSQVVDLYLWILVREVQV